MSTEFYDPDTGADAVWWLSLDDKDRFAAVLAHHRAHPEPHLHPSEADRTPMHVRFHAIVETQVATGAPPEVGATVDRLVAAGMRRHAVVHAVADVLARHLVALAAGADGGSFADELARIDPADVIARAMRIGLPHLAAEAALDEDDDDGEDDEDDDDGDDG